MKHIDENYKVACRGVCHLRSKDVHNPTVPGRTAVIGALIVWAIYFATRT